MVFSLLAIGLFGASSARAELPESYDFAALDSEIDAFVEKFQRVPQTGIAIGIVVDGKLVHFRGIGYRDREKKLPITKNTSFAIGSTTKSFVAAALATAAKEGLIDWNRPVGQYVPEFALEDPLASQEATLIDLLSHNTGLPRHDLVWYLTSFTSQNLLERIPYLPLTTKEEGLGFRSGKMLYSNLMFLVAGTALERVTGKSWFQAVKQRILDPLGMRATGETSTEFLGASESAVGYSGEQMLPINSKGLSMGPAGFLHSTVSDLAQYLAWQMKPRSGDPLQREELDFLHAPRTDASDRRAGEMKYGLAWIDTHIEGERVIWHNGNIDGFAANLSFMPGRGLGVIVLVNQQSAQAFINPLKLKMDDGSELTLLPRLIFERLMGLPKPDSNLNLTSHSFSVPRDELAMAESSLDQWKFEGGLFSDLVPAVRGVSLRPWRFLLSIFTLAPNDSGVEKTVKTSAFYDRGYGAVDLLESQDGKKTLDYYGTQFPLRSQEVGAELRWFIPKEALGHEAPVTIESGSTPRLTVKFDGLSRPIVFVP